MDRERKGEGRRRGPRPTTVAVRVVRMALERLEMPQAKSQMLNPKRVMPIELPVAIFIISLPLAALPAALARILHFALQGG